MRGSINSDQLLARGITALAAVFLLSSIYVHLAQAGRDFIGVTLSHYALGRHGFVLVIGLLAIAACQYLLALLLYRLGHRTASVVSLWLAGTGALLVALFPVQPPESGSILRALHVAGAISQFLCFPLGLLLISTGLHNSALRTITFTWALVTGAFFMCLLVLFFSPRFTDFAAFGLLEKIDILLINAWLLLFPQRLLANRPPRPAEASRL